MALRSYDDDDPEIKRYGFTREDINNLARKLGVRGDMNVFPTRLFNPLRSISEKY
jgi:hypothetical protein